MRINNTKGREYNESRSNLYSKEDKLDDLDLSESLSNQETSRVYKQKRILSED
jgi:hypothetical protein